MIDTTSLLWVGLFVVAAAAVVIDLLIHRKTGESASWRMGVAETTGWITLALLFDLWILHARGREASVEFLAGYFLEKTLSIDNIFLFLVIFQSFNLQPRAQHRVLYYGVAGALALRCAFVFAGVALLDHFHSFTYIFGGILLITAVRMVMPRREGESDAWITRVVRRILPVAEDYEGDRFVTRQNGRLLATPLLLALVAIEFTDLIFAVDSVPAVLAITRDTFIAYSSNVFAVLGLRAIYFVLSGVLTKIRFLHEGLAGVLVFTGAKMVLGDYLPLSAALSLGVIAGILALTVAVSLWWPTPGHTRTEDGGAKKQG